MKLTQHFLIAMPSLKDPNFKQSLIYICKHNKNGAIGIRINRPLSIQLSEVLQSMDVKIEDNQLNQIPLLSGGPIQQEKGFVIHYPTKNWNSSLKLGDGIAITTSRDILEAIAKKQGPQKILVALGYTGWQSDQLEQEISSNVWLTCKADRGILFDTPFPQRWEAAALLLGVNINMISCDVGHA